MGTNYLCTRERRREIEKISSYPRIGKFKLNIIYSSAFVFNLSKIFSEIASLAF